MRRDFAKGTPIPRTKKNYRPTKSGAGMTRAGVAAHRRANPGSKLKTAVTGKVNYCISHLTFTRKNMSGGGIA